jgi:hypothetical protein
MEESIKNRRGLERFDLNLPARIELVASREEKEEDRILNLLTSDVCSGGAFFHTARPLPEGTEVKIDLVLPLDLLRKLQDDCDQAVVKVTGRVLRCETGGMAICFNKDYRIHPHRGGPHTRPTGVSRGRRRGVRAPR